MLRAGRYPARRRERRDHACRDRRGDEPAMPGFIEAALVIDARTRYRIGWRVNRSMWIDCACEALG